MHKIETLILELRETFVDIPDNKLAIVRCIAPRNRGDIDPNYLCSSISLRDFRRPNPLSVTFLYARELLPEPVPQSRILCGSGGIGARTVSPKWALNMAWILSRRCCSSLSLGRMYDFTSLLPCNLLSVQVRLGDTFCRRYGWNRLRCRNRDRGPIAISGRIVWDTWKCSDMSYDGMNFEWEGWTPQKTNGISLKRLCVIISALDTPTPITLRSSQERCIHSGVCNADVA